VIPSRVVSLRDAVRHIPSLDGMRAISVMLVFVAHAGLERLVPGGLGVTIFFFLSGFLITTLMRSEFEQNGHVSLRHFWLRRALRILPPFYLVLSGAVIASLLVDPPGTLSVPAIAAQGLHFTNYRMIWHGFEGQPAGTGVYWSLAVEEHFYLLFPWLFVGMQRMRMPARNQAVLLWVLCAAVMIWRCVLVFAFDASTDRTYLASDTRVDSILFGCALAVWGNPVLDRPALDERRWKFVFVPAAIVLLALTFAVRDSAFRETVRYSIQGLALTVIFIAVIRFQNWVPNRFLNLRPIAFLGVLSYSLYLVHYSVILAIWRILPELHPVGQALIAFFVSIALAWALYKFIERPCARLRKRLTD
jgi:peptidoglycan/LPS O-acetylase OafA/YrhL